MRMYVDPWEPGYGTAMDPADGGEDGPGKQSDAALDVDLELPADEWRPLVPAPGTATPDVIHVVDGVRRIDARIWLETTGASYPGIAASYAAGVVRCDLRAGAADLVSAQIERGLFTSAPEAVTIGTPPARYDAVQVPNGEANFLVNAVQARLRAVEEQVSASVSRDGDLLIADGPLHGRVHLANTLGYVKTHNRQYLPDRLTAVVTGLHPGQRSPIFTIQSKWPLHTWYLRLPGPTGSAWAGIVRVECTGELSTDATVALADVSAVTLPRFASTPYKDARAPQNLVPIAGLEKRLRALLGDGRVLHRVLVRAASGDGVPA